MHVQDLTSHNHFPLHVLFIISSQLLYDQQLQFLHVQSINQSIKLYMYQLGADKVVVVAKRSLLNIIMNRPPLALRLHSIFNRRHYAPLEIHEWWLVYRVTKPYTSLTKSAASWPREAWYSLLRKTLESITSTLLLLVSQALQRVWLARLYCCYCDYRGMRPP